MIKMTWIVKEEDCMGCGMCTSYCDGLEMNGAIVAIKNQEADCLREAAEVCPYEVIKEE